MSAAIYTPATLRGMRQTRSLFKIIHRQNQCNIKRHGDVNVRRSAELLAAKLALPDEQRQGVILALAEFIAYALHGEVLMPDTWQPLANSFSQGITHE